MNEALQAMRWFTLEELGAGAALNGKREKPEEINTILAELRRRDELVAALVETGRSAASYPDDWDAVAALRAALAAFPEPVKT